MGNLNAKGNKKPIEQIYLSPTSKKSFPPESNLPDFATAASKMLTDPRSPTVEYARTPIYRADMDAVVTRQSEEDVHKENSFTLEPALAVRTMSLSEKDNEEFEVEHAVSNDVLIQNEPGYETTKKRNSSSSQTASQGTASSESQRTTRHVSSTQQKHSLSAHSAQPLKVLGQSITDAGDATNTPSLSRPSVHAVGLLAALRSPGSASNKYQKINNE